ncbi:Uncharacterised protein [Chryseobacterium nakagawai]|uniref:hypothetical protein n=1 Tax=Chryseobacterium nakagawai TaxID=1241982 RepID=UPI000F50B09C|nr:hypothetical protein [Chryseobacterium nakagawai]VEH22750.1 Uncharacterised protein [Chryseobacterium nakagawai]
MKNPSKTFRNCKVLNKSQDAIGAMFLSTMKEATCIETGNDLLLAAYMLKLNNYFEIEDEFNRKFPIKFIKE